MSFDDVGVIAAKEVKEILSRGGTARARRGLIGILAFPVVVGLALGFAAGQDAGRGAGTALFPVALLAMGTAGSLAPDAIAGERERHTLETLLATPAPDAAILAGKLVAVVGYGWALGLSELFVVAVAALWAGAGRSPFGAGILAAVAVLALLEALMTASLGVLFSVRAPTVRAAQRRQAQVNLLASVVAGAANYALFVVRRGLVGLLAAGSSVAFLLIIDAALMTAARARFRRGRLLLD